MRIDSHGVPMVMSPEMPSLSDVSGQVKPSHATANPQKIKCQDCRERLHHSRKTTANLQPLLFTQARMQAAHKLRQPVRCVRGKPRSLAYHFALGRWATLLSVPVTPVKLPVLALATVIPNFRIPELRTPLSCTSDSIPHAS